MGADHAIVGSWGLHRNWSDCMSRYTHASLFQDYRGLLIYWCVTCHLDVHRFSPNKPDKPVGSARRRLHKTYANPFLD
jgi:hypothetical protein